MKKKKAQSEAMCVDEQKGKVRWTRFLTMMKKTEQNKTQRPSWKNKALTCQAISLAEGILL